MTNTYMKKKVSIDLILSVLEHDEYSFQKVIKHYERYIFKLCIKKVIDDTGKYMTIIDEEMKQLLEIKLLTALMKFKII
ncbi:helix-turn-helix domain-containing protein [Enterococcus faecalis]|nr:helix-turn-helix domain-containing protein [Enterococcus faecalis]